MIIYQCKKDNRTSRSSICTVCGERAEFAGSDLFWCMDCKIPLYKEECPLCKNKGKRIAADLRPVFPEERLLLEVILNKPFAFLNSSVWNAAGNIYYADGIRLPFSVKELACADKDRIRKGIERYREKNNGIYFESMMERFILANQERFWEIEKEALDYIKKLTKNEETQNMFVSFSGGKDSTVVSDLVMRACSNTEILHIFGDTTLEFPETLAYVERFKKEHPKTPVLSARNKEQDFLELCRVLGPPSRVMRWCCTVFKTGAITRKIQTLFRNKNRILTFYGIRRSESSSRSKYERKSASPKITRQITVSPIIDWLDFDVWLYLLSRKLDFNQAYRFGYARVGCWCCPNNSLWSVFLSEIYRKEKSEDFKRLLVDFARSIGKPDAEQYVESGKWKARQGGNGVEYAKKSLVSFKPCATQENAFYYELQKPLALEFYELWKPFGVLNFEIGNSRLGEVYVIGRDGVLSLKLQGKIGDTKLKVTVLRPEIAGAKGMYRAEEKVKCQITKYQMCLGCLACEGVCRFGAISVRIPEKNKVEYKIDEKKCTGCGECINHFDAGCYMRKVLAIKRNQGG